ncbi:MAG: molybdopterin oxidoreductase family protein [Chloroflexota bacterium]|nr:molybdopterin oxidoreductase family protein [Chloroflexota bacterium]
MTDGVVRGACPHDCPDTCSWLVTVRNGRAVRIEGDPTHPHTRGFLCAKVRQYLSLVYHPDRILHPLMRVGAKGEGRFQRVSWEEALDTIARRWTELCTSHGPETILPYSYSGTLGVVHNDSLDRRFFHRLGASELDRTICSAAGTAGIRYTLGARLGADPETMPQARLVLIWGANPASTHPHYVPLLQLARRNGAQVVLIDPRRTRTANHADWFLPIFPGTDAALALGMMHVLARDDMVDESFIQQSTVGFQALRQRVAEYPPDRVSAITRLPVADIERLAHLYGTSKPALIRLGYGPQRHQGGGMAHRTVACLPALTGQYGVAGGGLLFSTSDWARFNTAALERPDLRIGRARTVNMVQLGRALLHADPAVRSLYVYNSNPAVVAPDQNQVLQGLRRDDLFTVVHEILPTDTTDYADIVLPATTQLERLDLHKAYGTLCLGLNQPAILPLGEARSNTDVFRLLARAMGFQEPYLYDSDEALVRSALSSGDPALHGITLESLRETGWARLTVPTPAVPFADGRFPTPSGKVELSSAAMAAAGLDPLPNFTPEAESPDGDASLSARFPLYLITPGAHHFLNSSFASIPKLVSAEGQPRLLINPADARTRSIADADWVMLHNDRGRCLMHARVCEDVPPGVVSTSTLWWNKLSEGGSGVNALVGDGLTDMGGGPLFYNAMVEVNARPAAQAVSATGS